MDYLSNLPNELSTLILGEYLDQKTQGECLLVSKKINQFVSSELLSKLGIILNPNLTPSAQLMSYYKGYCNFFCKKIPTLLNNCRTKQVYETKQNIDRRLSLPTDPSNQNAENTLSLLNETWSRFVFKLQPIFIHCRFSKLPNDERFNDSYVLEPDQEVQTFLRAGATEAKLFGLFKSIIEQSWCSVETVQTLNHYKFKVSGAVISFAIKTEKFKHLVPALIKSCGPNSIWLPSLFNDFPPDYEHLLEENYIDKYDQLIKVEECDIQHAILNGHSEKFIAKLLKNCPTVDDSIVRLALQGTYSTFSEGFILDLLKKCSLTLEEYHIRQALGRYSLYVIEKIYDKITPQTLGEFSADLIDYVMFRFSIEEKFCQLYDENLIEFLFSHVKKDELTQSLKSMRKWGFANSYQRIVEKYSPKVPIQDDASKS